jgi:hypothetical protein
MVDHDRHGRWIDGETTLLGPCGHGAGLVGLPDAHPSGHDPQIREHVTGNRLEQVTGHVLGGGIERQQEILDRLDEAESCQGVGIAIVDEKGMVPVGVQPCIRCLITEKSTIRPTASTSTPPRALATSRSTR